MPPRSCIINYSSPSSSYSPSRNSNDVTVKPSVSFSNDTVEGKQKKKYINNINHYPRGNRRTRASNQTNNTTGITRRKNPTVNKKFRIKNKVPSSNYNRNGTCNNVVDYSNIYADQEEQEMNDNTVTTDGEIVPDTTAAPTVCGTSDALSNSHGGYYGGGGMLGSSMMMMPPPPMYMSGPFTGLYQALYGIQNIVFSITQAVQMIGMNEQLLKQAYESVCQMIDHAICTFKEMRALESQCVIETEEDIRRRKRLKVLRYTIVFGGSWLTYKLVRNLLFRKRHLSLRSRLTNTPGSNSGYTNNNGFGNMLWSTGMSSFSPYSYGGGGMGYNNYSPSNSMYNGAYGYSGSYY